MSALNIKWLPKDFSLRTQQGSVMNWYFVAVVSVARIRSTVPFRWNQWSQQPRDIWHQDKQKRLEERKVRSSEVSLKALRTAGERHSTPHCLSSSSPQHAPDLATFNSWVDLAMCSVQINPQAAHGKAVERQGRIRWSPFVFLASFLEAFTRIHSFPLSLDGCGCRIKWDEEHRKLAE